MCRDLTVLCPGIILEIEDSFRLRSPLLDTQTKADPSCSFHILMSTKGWNDGAETSGEKKTTKAYNT